MHLCSADMPLLSGAPAAAPYVNKPEYMLAQQYANDIADLLAPQSGAYYDVWLDGEKFVSVYKEVSWVLLYSSTAAADWLRPEQQ